MSSGDVLAAEELVARFGSPVYAYDLAAVRRARTLLEETLPSPHRLLYSLKANPLTPLVTHLRELGCGAEVSSAGEVRAALEAGHDPGDLLYTGPGKDVGALEHAVRLGVRRFSVESAADARRTARVAERLGAELETLLRLNLPADAARLSLRMGGQAQFGMPVEEAAAVVDELPGLRAVGLHIYQGSNVPDEGAFVALVTAALDVAREWRERGLPLEVLNLGGGFPAPHGTGGPPADFRGVRSTVAGLLDRAVPGWRDGAVRVVFESGRYLTAGSGRLVCRVLDVKSSGERRYVVTDSGIHHLGGLSGLGRLLPLNPRPEVAAGPGGEPHTVVGTLCTPADSWGSVPLHEPRIGSLLTVPNVGAYGLTASLLGFLSHPAPLEVVTDGPQVVAVHRTTVTSVSVDPARFESGTEQLSAASTRLGEPPDS